MESQIQSISFFPATRVPVTPDSRGVAAPDRTRSGSPPAISLLALVPCRKGCDRAHLEPNTYFERVPSQPPGPVLHFLISLRQSDFSSGHFDLGSQAQRTQISQDGYFGYLTDGLGPQGTDFT